MSHFSLGMRQIHLTVLCLHKVNTVKQNRPFLTHALKKDLSPENLQFYQNLAYIQALTQPGIRLMEGWEPDGDRYMAVKNDYQKELIRARTSREQIEKEYSHTWLEGIYNLAQEQDGPLPPKSKRRKLEPEERAKERAKKNLYGNLVTLSEQGLDFHDVTGEFGVEDMPKKLSTLKKVVKEIQASDTEDIDTNKVDVLDTNKLEELTTSLERAIGKKQDNKLLQLTITPRETAREMDSTELVRVDRIRVLASQRDDENAKLSHTEDSKIWSKITNASSKLISHYGLNQLDKVEKDWKIINNTISHMEQKSENSQLQNQEDKEFIGYIKENINEINKRIQADLCVKLNELFNQAQTSFNELTNDKRTATIDRMLKGTQDDATTDFLTALKNATELGQSCPPEQKSTLWNLARKQMKNNLDMRWAIEQLSDPDSSIPNPVFEANVDNSSQIEVTSKKSFGKVDSRILAKVQKETYEPELVSSEETFQTASESSHDSRTRKKSTRKIDDTYTPSSDESNSSGEFDFSDYVASELSSGDNDALEKSSSIHKIQSSGEYFTKQDNINLNYDYHPLDEFFSSNDENLSDEILSSDAYNPSSDDKYLPSVKKRLARKKRSLDE